MLCSLKTKRPDKILERRLLFLSYSLVLLTITVILFMLYPEYFIYFTLLTVFISAFCLFSTIKTLKVGEEAISYGGFANEILRNDYQGRRIDNSSSEPVIENDYARDFFKDTNIIEFLKHHLSEHRQNKTALNRLETALENLTKEKVSLSLKLSSENDKNSPPEEWIEISVRPIYLKKTDIFEGPYSVKAIKKDTYFYWSFKNISASRNMEQVFQDERRSLHDFLDYLPAGLYVCNKNYIIEYCNHALAKMLGLSREDINGHNLKEFLALNSSLPQAHTSSWRGRLYLVNNLKETNEYFVAQENFRENSEIKTRGIIVTDLPNDSNLKDSLEDLQNRLSGLFNFAPLGIIFCDMEYNILDCNPPTSHFLELEKKHLTGKNLLSLISKDDLNNFTKETQLVTSGQKDFSTLDIHIDNGKHEHVALLYISPLRKLHAAIATDIEGCIIYMIDATARKNLEMQFAQAQKMQAMGQLAGGVAHDFNNLLTAMIGFCDLLLQRHGVGDPSFTDIIQIKQNANRAAGLVRQLLAFSRKQPLKPKLIEVTENFVELSQMLKRILGEQINLKFHHGTDLGYIRVDTVQFSQVIINLAVNAKDAMNNQGTLSISTRVENLTEPYQFGADTIKPGEFVVIEVKDTGCGIAIENLTRIFEPFFSTKQNVVGSGTGLGLAMVYGIVRQTEGFIKVDSIISKGTTFSIYLPRFDKPEEVELTTISATKETIINKEGATVLTVQEKINSPVTMNQKLIFGLNVSSIDRSHESGNSSLGDIRILFVEDEDSVRTFAVRALKKKGYDIVGCNSAENALEQLEHDPNFNLMITDMVMPGLNGAELAGIVKAKIPSIKIILASGYSEEIARKDLACSEEFAFIAKPFSLGDLTKKVFDVLNSK